MIKTDVFVPYCKTAMLTNISNSDITKNLSFFGII